MQKSKIKLVVFDFDGVLVDTHQILELAERCRVRSYVEKLMLDWRRRGDSPSENHHKAVRLFKGLTYTDTLEIANNLPIMPGAEEVIAMLKQMGLKIAVITNGYSVTIKPIVEKWNIDYAFANELEFVNGKATGEFREIVGDAEGKVIAFERVLSSEKILADQCMVVGDGINDILIVKMASVGIAFNATDESLREAADVIVDGKDLRLILPYIHRQIDGS